MLLVVFNVEWVGRIPCLEQIVAHQVYFTFLLDQSRQLLDVQDSLSVTLILRRVPKLPVHPTPLLDVGTQAVARSLLRSVPVVRLVLSVRVRVRVRVVFVAQTVDQVVLFAVINLLQALKRSLVCSALIRVVVTNLSLASP